MRTEEVKGGVEGLSTPCEGVKRGDALPGVRRVLRPGIVDKAPLWVI